MDADGDSAGDRPVAVLESFGDDARILFVDARGVQVSLTKSAETTSDPPTPYLGHTFAEVKASAGDLLGAKILSQPGDPAYAQISGALPPLRKARANIYSFIGTPDNRDKVYFNYGGRTANFDPAVYEPSVRKARSANRVLDGLVGGYLPVLRFVYPDAEAPATEMLAFAPFRTMNGNDRVQPGVSGYAPRAWAGCNGCASSTPTCRTRRETSRPAHLAFYSEPAADRAASGPLLLEQVHEHRAAGRTNGEPRPLLRCVRALMTRIDNFPKYGVVENNYGGSRARRLPRYLQCRNHRDDRMGNAGPRRPPTSTTTSRKFVSDGGVLVYRGPETGQFGRMLTVLAQYAERGRR